MLRYKQKYPDRKIALVFALAQNPDEYLTMVSKEGILPCFTKSGTKRLFYSTLGCWLTEREKLAASGLAVSSAQAPVAGMGSEVPWQLDCDWHQKAGNGNQLQNIGVVLIAALARLRLKPETPGSLFDIEEASVPDGLVF